MPVVLVVDDSAPTREMIRIYLSTIGCEVRLAGDGMTALEMVHAEPPDLVLLDVRMPGTDGYVITGLSQTTHRVMALEAGADDFMAKPVEGAELIA
ncbi:MAG TPA: response regulator [Candidatus Dormibacteraeota bacterium]|nr:response regulator [Candidatus Dormibacteraeota bacterium]